jgi:uncharacterized protein
MSRAPADLVNAVELAGRAARLERRLALTQMPRVAEAGALEGTHVTAQLEFGYFEGRVTIAVQVHGELTLTCQRCLKPCTCSVEESASLALADRDSDEVPGGYELQLGDPERLSLTGLIEEQVLLGMPLVPVHIDAANCGAGTAAPDQASDDATAEEKQRPFANLRQLLDKGTS